MNKVTIEELKEIIEYICKCNGNINFDDYKFVLTDEEIYVLKAIINKIKNIDSSITWEDIAYNIYYNEHLIKKKIDEEIIKQLLKIAYKKMLYIDNDYGHGEKRKHKFQEYTLADALGYSPLKTGFSNSIMLEEYDKFCKEGFLFTATSRLQRFILKYKIGMMYMYRQLSLNGKVEEFYDALSFMCQKLGYIDYALDKDSVQNILINMNNDLVWMHNLLMQINDMNKADKLMNEIRNELNIINEQFRIQDDMLDFDNKMAVIKQKLSVVNNIFENYKQKDDEEIKKHA